MPFTKDTASEAGKASSRKGVPNKASQKTRDFIIEFLEADQEQALKDWDKLDAKERWNIRAKLFEYAAPKQKQVRQDVRITDTSQNLTDELRKRLDAACNEN